MALGGGTFTYQDKILPGTYINFTNPNSTSTGLTDRGTVIVPVRLNWGQEGEVFSIASSEIFDNCTKMLGYGYTHENMVAVRELFANASDVLFYRLSNDTIKASNIYATAKYGGTRGNDITISIVESIDREDYFKVYTYLDGTQMDMQEVATAGELTDNDYVNFVLESTLAEISSLALTGGNDGEDVTGDNYTAFLSKAENYSYDILCCPTDDSDTIALFIAFSERMTDETGSNFQLVCYRSENPDWEGVINVENAVNSGLSDWGLVYWVAGAQAGCQLGESLTSYTYNGELEIDVNYTQTELKELISSGMFAFHSVNSVVKVLKDINSYVSVTAYKGEDFSSNQTIRVCMAISSSVASVFNTKYLGTVANDNAGRISLWNDICNILSELEDVRAISDYSTGDIVVSEGDNKNSVVCTIDNLMITGAMETLYITVVIA